MSKDKRKYHSARKISLSGKRHSQIDFFCLIARLWVRVKWWHFCNIVNIKPAVISAIKVRISICILVVMVIWNHGNNANLLNATSWFFTKINFCHNVFLNIHDWFSGHIIHTSYDIKITINQSLCPVPQNLDSVQTKKFDKRRGRGEIWQLVQSFKWNNWFYCLLDIVSFMLNRI